MPPRVVDVTLQTNPPTRLLISEYTNQVFLLLTQLNRMGTLVSAYVENPEDTRENYVYAVEVRFGDREDERAEALARALLERLSKTSFKPLLLSVALVSPLEEVFSEVVKAFESTFLSSASPELVA